MIFASAMSAPFKIKDPWEKKGYLEKLSCNISHKKTMRSDIIFILLYSTATVFSYVLRAVFCKNVRAFFSSIGLIELSCFSQLPLVAKLNVYSWCRRKKTDTLININ